MRSELCHEAIRLVALLLGHPATTTPSTQALAALMRLHAARLPARVDAAGNLSSLLEQDRSLWDPALVRQGLELLDLSARGDDLTEYHLEAAIASLHATSGQAEDTDWAGIVALYDKLYAVRPSPVVALNRAIAVAQHEGPARGLEVLASIPGRERLSGYPFYAAALGELKLRSGRREVARGHFRNALALARSPIERRFLEQRVGACDGGGEPRPTTG